LKNPVMDLHLEGNLTMIKSMKEQNI